MSRINIFAFASAALIALGVATTANASGDGGGGNERFSSPPPAANPAAARPAAVFRGGANAQSTLPDGTRITSIDRGRGQRAVTTQTPDGQVTRGRRGAVAPKDKVNRTVYNPQTGITSTFARNADGTVSGVHVDRQGNRSTSTSGKPAAKPAP